MSSSTIQHLTIDQRIFIKFQILEGKSSQEIFNEWNIDIHNRPPPSIQTINSIKRQLKKKDCVHPKKPGPRTRSVLTVEKLDKVKAEINKNDKITFRQLSIKAEINLFSTHEAVKLLNLKQFDAVQVSPLNEVQKIQRVQFCTSFLNWNNQYRMSVWWTDESLFNVELIQQYRQTSYFCKENENRNYEKILHKKNLIVWAGIRGDGNVVYDIQECIMTSEIYIQVLLNKVNEMEPKTSFLMQDGAGIHTSADALDWINCLWGDRWIGLKSPRLVFPPYSMDLTPMDFSFWSFMKRRVAQHNPETTEKLWQAIEYEFSVIPSEIIINMYNNVVERCRKCVKCNGERFE